MELLRQFSERLEEVQRFQSVGYQLERNPIIDKSLSDLYFIDDDDLLYRLSLQAQPSMWVLEDSQASLRASTGDFTSDFDDTEFSEVSDTEEELDTTSLSSDTSDKDDSRAKSLSNSDSAHSVGSESEKEKGEDEQVKKKREEEAKRKKEEDAKREERKRRKERQEAKRRKEIKRKSGMQRVNKCHAVSPPAAHLVEFVQVERLVDKHFALCHRTKERGTIELGDERYIALRSETLASELFAVGTFLFPCRSPEETRLFVVRSLFDLGHVMGISDAKFFRSSLPTSENVTLNLVALAAVNLAYSGWGRLHFHPSCDFSPQSFRLQVDFKISFEASSWSQDVTAPPGLNVCSLNSGCLSGWCTEAAGHTMVSVEVKCRAQGSLTR